MLQTLEKGLNFEFKDVVDKEEREEQQRLCELWEQGCRSLGFDIEKIHDRGDAAWVARPRPRGPNRIVSRLQIYIKVLEAYEFAAGSPDKALLLQKCVEELNFSVPSESDPWDTSVENSYEKNRKFFRSREFRLCKVCPHFSSMTSMLW